jgi:hypothetical protein
VDDSVVALAGEGSKKARAVEDIGLKATCTGGGQTIDATGNASDVVTGGNEARN